MSDATFIDDDGKVKMRIATTGGTEMDGLIFVDSDGLVKMRALLDGLVVTSEMLQDGAVTDAKLADPKVSKAQVAALTPLADPATATSQQIATLLNQVVAALKA